MAQRFYEPIARIFTNAGAIGVGYKYYFYQTGTITPVTTYQNNGLTVANTNPVLSDANGRFSEIWYSDLSQLKLIVKDLSNNTLETIDPVGSTNSAVSLNDFDVRPTSYWGLTAGTSTAFTLIANPTISSYTNTQTFVVQPHLDCGDSPTLAIDGLFALNWKKYTQQGTKVALKANDLKASQKYFCINDNVDIVVLNPTILPIQSGSSTALTIASGVVSLTNNSSSYVLDTEGAVATDDLDTINGGQDGQIVILNSANAARNVVVKHNTGNIYNPNAFDITLDLTTDLVVLRYDATAVKWIVISVSAFGSSPSVLILSQTASNASSIQFTGSWSVFSKIKVDFNNIVPTVNGAGLIMQVSTDNGATFINSLYESDGLYHEAGAGPSLVDTVNNATRFTLVGFDALAGRGISNTSTKGGLSGSIKIFNPASTAQHKVLGDVVYPANGADYITKFYIFGRQFGTTAINGIRFKMSTANADTDNGTIASGTFKLYGII